MGDLIKMLAGCVLCVIPAGLLLASAPQAPRPPQAPPARACDCAATGKCACGPACPCPGCETKLKEARWRAAGWKKDARGWYRVVPTGTVPIGAAVPAPVYYLPAPPPVPAFGFGGGFRGGCGPGG